MEVKQLLYFLTIAEIGSYSNAAEQLGVSQPALSLAIKKLEKEMGTPLFYSFDRRQRLTDAGLRLQKGALQLKNLYHQTLEDVKESDTSYSGSFTLGLSPLFGTCFFSDLIPAFTKKYPDIEISVVEDGANRINEKIQNGTVDLAVTLNINSISPFSHCHFTTQRNVAVLPKNHPLADRETLTVADLQDEYFAIFNQDFILNAQILDACHQAGFHPKIALLSSQWDFMVSIVAKNQAVSILPKPMMERYPNPDVVYIPLTDSMKYWDVVLAWNEKKYMPRACELFLNYVKSNLPADDL